jgi:uncharacterized membrane protein
MTFVYPYALLGLLLIPYFLWLGKPRGAWARNRTLTAMILRGLIVVLLVLALAGLQIVRAADNLAVVFLIDASDSMPESAVDAARAYAQEAMQDMGPNDEAAVIIFGSDALVERPMSPVRDVGPFESKVLPLNTDLAEAIRLGMALFPPGSARRMVILSDGLANSGDAEQAARLASASGVQILAVPFSAMTGDEILVTDVSVPTRLNKGQVFDITVTVESNIETQALLRILGGGEVVVEQAINLVQGVNRYTFTLTASEPGLTSFKVQIVPTSDDVFYQNNELSAFTQVVGPPRVLVIANEDFEIANLGVALLEQGLTVDRTTGPTMPADLATLSGYQSIILVNIPASDLGPRRMQAIQTYVRDLGGGLVVIGGPRSYAVGGYFETPLEETLPVEMQLKDEERLPKMTVVYVIDKSGSMADTSLGGFQKVELAKEAIIRSVNLLTPLDYVGVVAFDENATWVVPITSAADKDAIARLVGGIRADGGTDIFAGVLAVSKVLPDAPGELRHVVLLSDGGADPSQNVETVRAMYEDHGITFSVIAIGQGYAPWIEELPKVADGRFHYAADVDTIPEIFSEETVLATRAYTIEGEFFPALTSTSPIMNGVNATPSLLGYIGSTIKPTAQQILVTNHDDPLLAAWQYGLGRSVAWTSDATGRWAANWVGWPDYARFWGQAVRWTITEGTAQNVEVRVVQEGETSRVIVDAVDEDGEYLNGLDLDANVVSPDLTTTTIDLQQVAPGRYEGTFQPGEEGAYFVRVAGAQDGEGSDAQTAIAQTAGWVLAYSPEYRSLEGDPDYLEYITGLAGGTVLESPESIFAHNLAVERTTQPVWPWLVLAATLLLPFDIAVRRLVITRADLQKLAAWAGVLRRAAEPVVAGSSRVGSLLDVKERAVKEAKPQATATSRATLARLKQSKVDQPNPAPTAAPAADQTAAPVRTQTSEPLRRPSAPATPPAGSRGTASALLKNKKSRKGDDED